jgi:hypothetical protein
MLCSAVPSLIALGVHLGQDVVSVAQHRGGAEGIDHGRACLGWGRGNDQMKAEALVGADVSLVICCGSGAG